VREGSVEEAVLFEDTLKHPSTSAERRASVLLKPGETIFFEGESMVQAPYFPLICRQHSGCLLMNSFFWKGIDSNLLISGTDTFRQHSTPYSLKFLMAPPYGLDCRTFAMELLILKVSVFVNDQRGIFFLKRGGSIHSIQSAVYPDESKAWLRNFSADTLAIAASWRVDSYGKW
jgi:hypothetical protein